MALTPPPSAITPRNQRTPSIEPAINSHAGAMRNSFSMDMYRSQAPGSNNSAHANNANQPHMHLYSSSNGMPLQQPASGQMRGQSPGQMIQDPRGQSPVQMLPGPPQSQLTAERLFSPRNDMPRAGPSPPGGAQQHMQQLNGFNPASMPREGSVPPMWMYPGSHHPPPQQNGYNANNNNNLRSSQQSVPGQGFNGTGGMPAQSPNGVWASNVVSRPWYTCSEICALCVCNEVGRYACRESKWCVGVESGV
jgi:hypothetical protein